MALPDKDKEPATLIVLDDLRRLFDHLSSNYHTLKNRVLGLIAGEVAITSFIFSDGGFRFSEFTSAERIFFFIGGGLLSVAFGQLIWIIATADWQIPMSPEDSKDLYKRFNSKLDYLEHIKKDYENCINFCLGKVSLRARVYNRTLFVLSGGIIIMLVLKFTT